MTVAGLLSQQQHLVTVIDKRQNLSTLPRGIAVNQNSLATFDQLQIGVELERLSMRVPCINLRRNASVLGRIDFHQLSIERPYFCHVTQDMVERILYERLSRLGVSVHRGVELHALTSTPTEVQATCIDHNGMTRTFSADILIACDGGNSTVRTLLGLQVDQQTYCAYFLLADVTFEELPLPPGETHYFFCRDGYLMLVPIPGKRHRVILSVKGPHSSPADIDRRLLEDTIAARTGMRVRVGRVDWTTQSSFGHKVSRSARCGHVFLAGDSLHQFSPIGGTNMNVGIEDAAAFARSILHRRIDEYEAQRLDAIRRHIQLTQYLTRLLARPRDLAHSRRPFVSRSLRALLENEIPRLLTGFHDHPYIP